MIAKFSVDTAESDPSKVWRASLPRTTPLLGQIKQLRELEELPLDDELPLEPLRARPASNAEYA